MTIFDSLKYPISDTFTREEWEQLPAEIRNEINIRYSYPPNSYPGRDAYVQMVRNVIAEYNTK